MGKVYYEDLDEGSVHLVGRASFLYLFRPGVSEFLCAPLLQDLEKPKTLEKKH
jgi:hypothetical protein